MFNAELFFNNQKKGQELYRLGVELDQLDWFSDACLYLTLLQEGLYQKHERAVYANEFSDKFNNIYFQSDTYEEFSNKLNLLLLEEEFNK